MGLLNYTTKIPVEKTIAEIEKMLAESGAEKILKDYDEESRVTSISFILNTEKGKLSFKLPMNVQSVLQTLQNQSGEYKRTGRIQRRIIPQSMVNLEQAGRVGWRIIKDWLEAQLAIFFLQMVKIEEIFLPYMYNEKTGKTMFEMLEETNFKVQIEHKK